MVSLVGSVVLIQRIAYVVNFSESLAVNRIKLLIRTEGRP